MIKGVNKKVIEINNPESSYFDKVVLYIKPSKEIRSKNELSLEIDRYLKSLVVKDDYLRNTPKEKSPVPFILVMAIILMVVITILLI